MENRTDRLEQDWSVIFDSGSHKGCSERALVLHAVNIPCEVVAQAEGRYLLVVARLDAERAKYELWQFEQENADLPPVVRTLEPDYRNAVPGVIVYLLVILAVGWMSTRASFGLDWVGAGRVDGELIRDGDWWRNITALTLHSGTKHILGNMVFGLVFGIAAGGLLGPGFVWLCIVIAGALGNALNVGLLDPSHRSIGASTAVFAALGIISGFVWRMRLMAQDRWAWRLGPVVGGIALLAYSGTGDETTDVGAHVAGFACGFIAGLLVARMPDLRNNRRFQWLTGGVAMLLVTLAWWLAHLAWNS